MWIFADIRTSTRGSCGFLPVPVPNRPAIVRAFLTALPWDGVILTGGNDLAAYGGSAPDRDETEALLIGRAAERNVPLLGVCRGAQMLACHYGASLQRVEGHVRTTHTLTNGKMVNSFHSWGMAELPETLKVTALAPDGTIEEFHHRSLPFYGVQWHPERFHPFRAEDIAWIREVLEL